MKKTSILLVALIIFPFGYSDKETFTSKEDSDFEKWIKNPTKRNEIVKRSPRFGRGRRGEQEKTKDQIYKEIKILKEKLRAGENELRTRGEIADYYLILEDDKNLPDLLKIIKEEEWFNSSFENTLEKKDEKFFQSKFGKEVIDSLYSRVQSGTHYRHFSFMEPLFKVDFKRAVKTFYTNEYIDPGKQSFTIIMRMLFKYKAPIKTELLIDLKEKCRMRLRKGLMATVYKDILLKLAERKVEGITLKLEFSMYNVYIGNYGRYELLTAWCGLKGFQDPMGYVYNKFGKPQREKYYGIPLEKQNKFYQMYLTINKFDSQVRNGGIEQYFGNGYGYQFRTLIEHVKELDSDHEFWLNRILNDFEKALGRKAKFNLEEQAKVYDEMKETYSNFNSSYYGNEETLSIVLQMYFFKHKNEIMSSKWNVNDYIPKKSAK